MLDDVLRQIAAERREHWQAFEARHPKFADVLERLARTLREAFERDVRTYDERWHLIFALARVAVEEFEEIVFVAASGYGYGAQKLLRPLYERVVTTRYLMLHQDQVPLFSGYADRDALSLIRRATNLQISVGEESQAAIADAYEKQKQDLIANRCPKCGRGTSWTGKDVQAMADELDKAGLGRMYAGGFFWPSLLIHTTRLPLDDRLQPSDDRFRELQREYADGALRYAHCLVMGLLFACNGFFEWGLARHCACHSGREKLLGHPAIQTTGPPVTSVSRWMGPV